jgi:saccharopine dehydrogenase-like NADP-dependent oxidoreductase
MKVLLVGVGGVGEAIAVVSRDRPWLEKLVLCDYNLDRAKEVQAKVGAGEERMPVEFVDAGDQAQVEALARKPGVDLIHNAGDPVYNEAIFEAAYNVGCTYMDMA